MFEMQNIYSEIQAHCVVNIYDLNTEIVLLFQQNQHLVLVLTNFKQWCTGDFVIERQSLCREEVGVEWSPKHRLDFNKGDHSHFLFLITYLAAQCSNFFTI